jgi:opacity protein-like surface antigen
MKRGALLALAMLFAFHASPADAQGRGRGGGSSGFHMAELPHRLELSGLVGYNWQSSYVVSFLDRFGRERVGELDAVSAFNWGIELDVNVRPGMQLALLYNRMDTEATFRQTWPSTQPKETIGDLTVEYYHIGALSGVYNGTILPYGGLTLGGTRFVGKAGGQSSDAWKFSFTPQVGAKAYVHEKIALRVHARLPITLIQSGFGFGFGSGGSFVAIDGVGTVGFDLGGGIMILLG